MKATRRGAIIVCFGALLNACFTSDDGSHERPVLDLRVATLNLMNQSGGWEHRRPHLEVELARLEPDIVAFQEVMNVPGEFDQTQWIAATLGSDVAFEPMIVYPEDIEFGLAIASRFPIVEFEVFPLPAPEHDPRILQHVVVETALGRLHVYNTHLSYRLDQGHERVEQTARILELVAETNESLPPILLGDFNAEPDSPEMLAITTPMRGGPSPFVDAWRIVQGYRHAPTWNRDNPLTQASEAPSRRIDYVLIGRADDRLLALPTETSLFCHEPGQDGVWPSDHAGVTSRVRLVAP